MDFLRLENQQLRERFRLLQVGQDRARATVAEYIYYSNLEQDDILNKIKFLKDQIAQLKDELVVLKKKEAESEAVNKTNVAEMDESTGDLKNTTLDKMVQHLYSGQEGHLSADYRRDFLMTYRSFTTPNELLTLLREGFEGLVSISLQDNITKFHKIVSFMKKWMQEYYSDFQENPLLLDEYTDFSRLIMAHNANLGKSLLDTVMKGGKDTVRLAGSTSASPIFSEPAPIPIVPKVITSIVDINPLEVARQLTLVDYNLCKEIKPKECLGCAWMKSDKEVRSPNILQISKRFNKVSRWIIGMIVKEANFKKRAKVLSHILMIVQHLRDLNNFNAIFQAVAGLGNSAVHRLTKTFAAIGAGQKKVLDELTNLTSTQSSWQNYRRTIRAANPPCVPFIGVYQTDLTFIEEANPTKFSDGTINLKKCRMIANVVCEIQQYQLKPYNLTKVNPVDEWITKSMEEMAPLDDKALFELSLVAEPRVSKQ